MLEPARRLRAEVVVAVPTEDVAAADTSLLISDVSISEDVRSGSVPAAAHPAARKSETM